MPGGGGGDAGAESSLSARWAIASDGAAESTAGVIDSAVGSSLLMPASSTWKFKMPMARLNPPVVDKVNPVEHG
jgi:hypothetical protein